MLKLAWSYMRYYKSQTLAIFASILLTASLLSGISSLIFRSQKNDLANSKAIYGNWHYYVAADEEKIRELQSGGQGGGYRLKQWGKLEIRDVAREEFLIYFIHTDEAYRQMAHRELIEGAFPDKENEIAADRFVLQNLGFSGNLGDTIRIGERDYVVTGVLKSKWAASADEMEVFVSDAFAGRGSQTFLYLRFDEDEKLYRQMDAFLKTYQFPFEAVTGNDEVIRYLGGEAPDSIYDIVKFGLTDEEGNLTYIVLKLQSDYNLAYHGMILLLCLFSIFVVYSVFHISAAKRVSEYGMLQTLGISGRQLGWTLVLELWMLFLIGYPLGCFLGNGILSMVYRKFNGVFGGKGIEATEKGLSVAEQTLAEGTAAAQFYLSWGAMLFGFVFLLFALALAAFLVIRALGKQPLKKTLSGDISFSRTRRIYARRPVNMAGVVVRKFMFANKWKAAGILLSLSIGGCIFLCTMYMTENLKVHAELSLKSDDGLGSEYRISLKSRSLKDTIPEGTADAVKNMPETSGVYATRYTIGELSHIEDEDNNCGTYFQDMNKAPEFERFGGICIPQADGAYRIKYDVYGYEEELLEQLGDFVLEGRIDPAKIRDGNQIVAVANRDGQGNYYFYGKKPGDTVVLRVPRMEGYTEDVLKFQNSDEYYVEQEFEIAAIVSRSLAREEGFLNTGVWSTIQMPCVIMTNSQMEENFGITGYGFINVSPAQNAEAEKVSSQLLQAIHDVPKAVLTDYSAAIRTQKNYLGQQQLFFSSIAAILFVISLFHIVNSMSHTIFARRREYGIIRAMGITDAGFYKMILQTGILYGALTDAVIFLVYTRILRRMMDYYMAHVLQFLHVQAGVPNQVFFGIMVLNMAAAVGAVMFPAWRLVKRNIISEITLL